MKELADKLYEVIKDYRNHDGVFIQPENITNWANQFGEDAEFMLKEISHLIPQVYLSKDVAKKCLKSRIEVIMKKLKYTSISNFLSDTEFLDMQPAHKSQKAILNLLNEIVTEEYKLNIADYITFPKKNYIYFDDVLATGGTIGRDIISWLKSNDDAGVAMSKHVLDGSKNLTVSVFCLHQWGFSNQEFRIMKEIDDSIKHKITWWYNYEIENHLKFNKQKLNIAIPVSDQPEIVKSYLLKLTADKKEDFAYRKETEPITETFFSSPENRIKYENIILKKGVEIIGMIAGEPNTNLRPLGVIHPAYKTYGLGTHFFTWRNIPNNSPLVFWWEVQGHNWLPLFSVANRGN
jgi:hypothetical protein